MHNARVSTAPQTFWCYKRGLLVLKLSSAPGVFIPTLVDKSDPDDVAADAGARCAFGSGQFLSTEWEPRVRLLLDRANDLVELIELLEDRRYQVDVEAPSMKTRPFRRL